MLRIGTHGELALAAGLWATTTAVAEPQSAMRLGGPALPPAGYVAFCERQPWDCGPDAQRVLARARRADAERAELFAWATSPRLGSLDARAALNAATPASERTTTSAPEQVPLPGATPPAASPKASDRIAAPVRMSPRLWSKLNRINEAVNTSIAEASDIATYGQADVWSTPLENGLRQGDCEDYVLEKERALLAARLPREALNIALVATRGGETHAVLLVNTSDGELVLDDLSRWVKPWDQTGYRWLERQVGGDPFTWVMIQDPSRSRSPAPQARSGEDDMR